MFLGLVINQSGWGESGHCSCLVSLSLQLVLTRYNFSVWPLWCVLILSHSAEKHPDPKSGRDLDPEKLRCTMSGRELKPIHVFPMVFFLIFIPDSDN